MFLCGEPFKKIEDVGHWMGAAATKSYPDLGEIDDPNGMFVVDDMA